jgi:hypothetical protein
MIAGALGIVVVFAVRVLEGPATTTLDTKEWKE